MKEIDCSMTDCEYFRDEGCVFPEETGRRIFVARESGFPTCTCYSPC